MNHKIIKIENKCNKILSRFDRILGSPAETRQKIDKLLFLPGRPVILS